MAERTAIAKERALWLMHQYLPDDGVLNVAFAVETAAALDLAALRGAVAAVVRRHPALRTLFVSTDGGLVRVTMPQDDPRVTGVIRPVEVPLGELPEQLKRAVSVSFDTAADLPVDVAVLTERNSGRDQGHEPRQIIVVTVCHLVYDAFSARVVRDELEAAYAALRAGRPLPDGLDQEVIGPALRDGSETDVAYWKGLLSGARPSPGLALGQQVPRARGLPGAGLRYRVPAHAWQAVGHIAHRNSCPPSAVLLAALAVVLMRHGAGDDLVFGVPAYNRGPARHRAVGYYTCIEPVRLAAFRELRFDALARMCAERMIEGLMHAEASIDQFAAGAFGGAAGHARPLIRYLFNYLADLEASGSAGSVLRDAELPTAYSRMDMDLAVLRDHDGVFLRAIYASDLFEPADVRILLERLEAVLLEAAAADAPAGELDIKTPADRRWSARPVLRAAELSLLEDVTASAFAHADQLAFAAAPGSPAVDYGGLIASAATLAEELRAAGISPGTAVAVLTRSVADAAIGILGCWAAGCAALLASAGDTADSRMAEARDRGAAVGGSAAGGQGVPIRRRPGVPGMLVLDPPGAADLALTWTGTGGTTSMSHAELSATLADLAEHIGLTSHDRVAAGPGTVPGAGLLAVMLALRSGAEIRPLTAVDEGTVIDAVRHGATVVVAPPVIVERLADRPPGADRARVLLPGGRLSPGLAGRAGAAGLDLIRVTGPDGPRGAVAAGPVGEGARPGDLGYPPRRREWLIVGEDGQPVLPLVRGALRCDGETERGRQVRLRPDGRLESVPRDPAERWQDRLLAEPQVRYAAVTSAADGKTVVAVEPRTPDLEPGRLAAALAAAGIEPPPDRIAVRSLPVAPDGSVDEAALALPAGPDDPPSATADPTDVLGVDLVALWRDVLGDHGVGADDDFFAAGGDSLMAARVISHLRKQTGRRISLRALFKAPTPRSFARTVLAAQPPGRN